MMGFDPRRLAAVVCALAVVCPAGVALAGIHTWDVKEVFSNTDGTIQFVELWEADNSGAEVNVGNGTLTSTTKSFAIGAGAVTGPTNNKHYLIGTPAFAALFNALPGNPTVDAVMPLGVLPFFFNPGGDTVSFTPYDSMVFPAIPTNGIDSYSEGGIVVANSPTNYAGQTGSVDASGGGPPVVPSASSGAWLVGLGLLMAAGIAALVWRRQATAA